MSTTDQNMRLHEEINNYKFMFTKMGMEINKVKSENQELTSANSVIIFYNTSFFKLILAP